MNYKIAFFRRRSAQYVLQFIFSGGLRGGDGGLKPKVLPCFRESQLFRKIRNVFLQKIFKPGVPLNLNPPLYISIVCPFLYSYFVFGRKSFSKIISNLKVLFCENSRYDVTHDFESHFYDYKPIKCYAIFGFIRKHNWDTARVCSFVLLNVFLGT